MPKIRLDSRTENQSTMDVWENGSRAKALGNWIRESLRFQGSGNGYKLRHAKGSHIVKRIFSGVPGAEKGFKAGYTPDLEAILHLCKHVLRKKHELQ